MDVVDLGHMPVVDIPTGQSRMITCGDCQIIVRAVPDLPGGGTPHLPEAPDAQTSGQSAFTDTNALVRVGPIVDHSSRGWGDVAAVVATELELSGDSASRLSTLRSGSHQRPELIGWDEIMGSEVPSPNQIAVLPITVSVRSRPATSTKFMTASDE